MQLTVGNDFVMSRDISLEAPATEGLIGCIFRDKETSVAQRALRMLVGSTTMGTSLLRMFSSTITRPSPSAIW